MVVGRRFFFRHVEAEGVELLVKEGGRVALGAREAEDVQLVVEVEGGMV